MLHVAPIAEGRILLLSAVAPFSMQDASRALADVVEGQIVGASVNMPFLVDARDVRLAALPTEDFVEFFRDRRTRGFPRDLGHMACVCDDLGSFGMLRMFGIYADVDAVRPEARFHVSTSLYESVRWLAEAGLGRGLICPDPDAE